MESGCDVLTAKPAPRETNRRPHLARLISCAMMLVTLAMLSGPAQVVLAGDSGWIAVC